MTRPPKAFSKEDWASFRSLEGMVRLILITTWDPIGVFGDNNTLDEYDNYVLPIIALLNHGASVDDIEALLYSMHESKMGFKLNDQARLRFRQTAKKIMSISQNRTFFANLKSPDDC